MKGIDISHFQGKVDFNKVKAAGIEAVYIKATEGLTYNDPMLKTYYSGAKAVGLKVGFYHFLRANDPVAEAKHYLAAVSGLDADMLHCIDIETTEGQGRDAISKRVRAFADYLISQGKPVVVYTYTSFYTNSLNSSVKDLPLWIARYGASSPGITVPYVGWQYDDHGVVPGITGNVVDMDTFYDGILIASKASQTVPKAEDIQFNAKVKELQRCLNLIGIRDNDNNKLDEDGKLGTHTREALGKLAIKRGTKNAMVGWIQKQLGVKVDNLYAKAPYHETYDALVKYQKARGLTVDAVAGINTILKMCGF